MKYLKLFEEFLGENIKKKIKGIDKKIKKQVKKREDLVNQVKKSQEDSDATSQMQTGLHKLRLKASEIEIQKQNVKKQIAMQKSQLATAKKKDKAEKELGDVKD